MQQISNKGDDSQLEKQADLSSLKVLVIDDDEMMLTQIALKLEQVGVNEISLRSSGASALAFLNEDPNFDVLFIDLNMPEMDGIEFIRNVAAQCFSGAIVLFSAEDPRILKSVESLAHQRQLNVIGAVEKPVTKASLQDVLAHVFDIKKWQGAEPSAEISAFELEVAINEGLIVPYFQPKVQSDSRQLVAVEVLSRWISKDGTVIGPVAFIPLAEKEGLINALTLDLFRQSMVELKRWQNLGVCIDLSINVSADSLSQVTLPEMLEKISIEYGVKPQQIVLEITESRLMNNITTSLDVLTRLRLKGFGLSIDDFGTGYSSMDKLNLIPFNELKIDRAFVCNALKEPSAMAILEASIEIAKKLNMLTVAEGAETEDDCQLVSRLGCDLIQGYHIAKPLSAEAFVKWISHKQLTS